ncbi:MAG: CHAT domain-containing protein, partial [Gemmatimonadaceae bacterium]|nr:CHAT domain-containing protein [Gemmatimonadaceae bacterium]
MVARRAATAALPLLLLVQGSASSDDPRAIARAALRAVEGDSATRVAGRWLDRLTHDPGDRAAALGLATIARLTYRYDAAMQRYRALVAADSLHPDRYAIYAWLGEGAALTARGMFKPADSASLRALSAARAAHDTIAEAEALLGLAVVRSRLQSAAAGLAAADSALRLIPPADTVLRIAYEVRRAALLAQGARPEAREAGARCAALARQAGERRLEASCLQSMAVDAERRGAIDSAIAILDRVATLQRDTRNHALLASALQWQGYLLSTVGQYGRARVALREAIASGERSDNQGAIAWAALSLATIANLVQDRAAAVAYVGRSTAAFRAAGDVWGQMAARELEVGLAIDAGELARARTLVGEQLAWARRLAQPQAAVAAHRQAAAIAERSRDWGSAARELDLARRTALQHGMAGVANDLAYDSGRLALRRGDLARAERELTAYLRTLAPQQHIFRYRARARLAATYAARGALDQAERELAAAGDELDAWRASLSDRELRVAAFQTQDDEDPDLGVPATLATLVAGARAPAAFALAERRRARELMDHLIQARALRATADVADPHALARAAGLSFAPGEPPRDVAHALPDDHTALLEYLTGTLGAPTTLFAITRAGVRAWTLPPADSLADAVERFTALLEQRDAPRALARSLGARVLDSAVAALGPAITHLVIVPDGPLQRLPFDALQLADGRYAVERFTIGIAPSAAVAVELWRRDGARDRARATRPARVLAFGDPVFGTERAGATAAFADDPGSGALAMASLRGSTVVAGESFRRLVASGREAELVARYGTASVVRVREGASESYLKHAPLDSFRVIHFATHAIVDDRSVARTALALAPGDGETGFVSPGDLAALHLDADLVVLSACRTAGGVLVTG